MKILDQPAEGLFLLGCFSFKDERGEFIKKYNKEAFKKLGIEYSPEEVVFSKSAKNVLRGMHFQTPPNDHGKLVTCAVGALLDVVLDLRKDSKTYGEAFGFELTEENRHALMIPAGFAHGFLSRSDGTILFYGTSTGYAPESDSAIRWDSFNYYWDCENPLVSEKDQEAVSFTDYKSPF